MKYTSSEPFRFKSDEYEEKARQMSPDALWVRQCLKYRTKVSSGCGIAFSGLMLVPTFGASVLGLWLSGRTLDVARTKEKLIDKEVARRNLPPYEKKKRDTLIPLAISGTTILTIGILDVLFLGMTSSAIVSAYGTHTINGLLSNPHEFLEWTWRGFELQLGQFFHAHGMAAALNPSHFDVGIGHDGLCYCISTPTPAPEGVLNLLSSLKVVKAQAATNLHSMAAAGVTHAHAHATAVTDQIIISAASHNQSVLPAGLGLGMHIGEGIERETVVTLIANTGGQSVGTNIKMDDPTSTAQEPNQHSIHKSVIKAAYGAALTGEKPQPFIFLSESLQPMSQAIVAIASPNLCQHFGGVDMKPKCHFCFCEIDMKAKPCYHCCICSSDLASNYDICEVCVAGRGCSCSNRDDHILYRVGVLTLPIEYGSIILADRRKFKKTQTPSVAESDENIVTEIKVGKVGKEGKEGKKSKEGKEGKEGKGPNRNRTVKKILMRETYEVDKIESLGTDNYTLQISNVTSAEGTDKLVDNDNESVYFFAEDDNL